MVILTEVIVFITLCKVYEGDEKVSCFVIEIPDTL